MRFDGVLRSWNDERGFGFLEPVQGGEQIFVHIKTFPPAVGRPLQFFDEEHSDDEERSCATVNVTVGKSSHHLSAQSNQA